MYQTFTATIELLWRRNSCTFLSPIIKAANSLTGIKISHSIKHRSLLRWDDKLEAALLVSNFKLLVFQNP